jgi:MFS family permease
MKTFTKPILGRFGFKRVLTMNTAMIGVMIGLYTLIGPGTPWFEIVPLSLALGFFNSLQFSSMNTLAYADVEGRDTSMASTFASSLQQLSMSFGLAAGSLVAGYFLKGLPQTDHVLVTSALHKAFAALAVITILSSLSFWRLRSTDGQAVSGGRREKLVEQPGT